MNPFSSLKFQLAFSDGSGNLPDPNCIYHPHQAALILNACPDNNWRSKQELTLIWFDTELIINSNDTQEIKKRLHTLNAYVLFYSDVDRLIFYLRTCQKEKVILITVTTSRSALPVDWNNNNIICFHLDTFDQIDNLMQDIDHYISKEFENERVSGRLIGDDTRNISQREVDNEAFRILCYRMYKQILFSMNESTSEQAKCEFLTLCRNRYPELSNAIDEFEQTYTVNDAIKWYTKDTFVYKLVNRALRTQDLECLFVLRFYLRNLTHCLKNEWNEWRNATNSGSIVTLYRGQVVNKEFRLDLLKRQGMLVSANGYLSTSQKEEVAKMFASVGTRLTEGESVLFDINVDLHDSNSAFANISRFSQMDHEEEVLFDLDTTFRIENVIQEYEDNVPYWRVRMSLAPDNGMERIRICMERRSLYDSTGFDLRFRAIPDVNPFDSFLRLNNLLNYLYRFELTMLDLSSTVEILTNDAALLHYHTGAKLLLCIRPGQQLNVDEQKNLLQGLMHLTLSDHLLTLDDRKDLAPWARRAIGLAHFKGGDYQRACEQFTRIIGDDNDDKQNQFHTAVCSFCLGLIHSELGHHELAISFFERALTYAINLPPIFEAQCQLQIGHSIELQGFQIGMCFEKARRYYEKALDVFENRINPPDPHALALCYAVIGNCYFFDRAFTDDSHRYFLKAADAYDAIYQQQAPPEVFTQARLLIVGTLFNIALSYYQKLSFMDEAKKCFKRVITYPAEHCPFDSFGLSHRYLGQIAYVHHEQYSQALEHFQASAQFYETHSPDDNWELASSNKWLAMVHYKQHKYQLSIDYAAKAIDLFLTPQPKTCKTTFVGNELKFLKENCGFVQLDEAANKERTHKQAMSETYRFMGDAYEQMNDMDMALAVYACALELNKDFTPIYQLETVEFIMGGLNFALGQPMTLIIMLNSSSSSSSCPI
ncbi:unnamed protein product, partial [Rotaria sp. Silwood1]